MIWDADTCFGAVPYRRADCSLETLLALLETHGIERALTYSLTGVHYDFEQGNAETLAACAQHPILLPVATVNPVRHLGCEETVRSARERGFVALRLFPDHQGWPLDFLPLLHLLDALADIGLPLILPAGGHGTATQALRMIGGRPIPLVLSGVGYSAMAEAIAAAREAAIYVTTPRLSTPDGIEVLASAIGEDRLLLGTDSPFSYPGAALECARRAEVSETVRTGILGGNLQALIGRSR